MDNFPNEDRKQETSKNPNLVPENDIYYNSKQSAIVNTTSQFITLNSKDQNNQIGYNLYDQIEPNFDAFYNNESVCKPEVENPVLKQQVINDMFNFQSNKNINVGFDQKLLPNNFDFNDYGISNSTEQSGNDYFNLLNFQLNNQESHSQSNSALNQYDYLLDNAFSETVGPLENLFSDSNQYNFERNPYQNIMNNQQLYNTDICNDPSFINNFNAYCFDQNSNFPINLPSAMEASKRENEIYSEKMLRRHNILNGINGSHPKPVFSYSCLIAMALKHSNSGCLPVNEIYKFMQDKFPYFKTAPDGWKNSVRHNLSLNKAFYKMIKPEANGHQRKGCLWSLKPDKKQMIDKEINKWLKKHSEMIKRSLADQNDYEYLFGNLDDSSDKSPTGSERFSNMTEFSNLYSQRLNGESMNSFQTENHSLMQNLDSPFNFMNGFNQNFQETENQSYNNTNDVTTYNYILNEINRLKQNNPFKKEEDSSKKQ